MRLRLCVTSTAQVLRCSKLERIISHAVLSVAATRNASSGDRKSHICAAISTGNALSRFGFDRARRRREGCGSATSVDSFPRTRRPLRRCQAMSDFKAVESVVQQSDGGRVRRIASSEREAIGMRTGFVLAGFAAPSRQYRGISRPKLVQCHIGKGQAGAAPHRKRPSWCSAT